MLTAKRWGALCAGVGITVAATTHAAITQEGNVQITPTTVTVGDTGQSTADGTLRVTPPSVLSEVGLTSAAHLATVHGNVFIDGGAITVSQLADVAQAGISSLNVNSSGQFSAGQLTIGDLPTADGSFIVTGAGSKLVTGSSLIVANSGIGELQVLAGAQLQSGGVTTAGSASAIIGNNSGALGSVTLDGADTTWEHHGGLVVGNMGTGSLLIAHGATVSSASAVVGAGTPDKAGALGSVVIDGRGSRWTIASSGLTIGDRGVGEVRVTAGGVLDAASSFRSGPTVLGRQAGSFGRLIVSGPDSTLINVAQVTVGQAGAGEMRIDGGAVLVTGAAAIGNQSQSSGSSGLVSVDGPATRWQPASLAVGSQSGSGRLDITGGATVAISGGSSIVIGPTGHVVLDNGRLAGRVDFPGNTQNSGLIEGDGTVTGSLINNSTGQVLVGPSDQLVISGTTTNNGAAARIEIDEGELVSAGMVNGGRLVGDGATLRTGGQFGMKNSGVIQFTRGANRVFGAVNNAYGATITVLGGAQATFYDQVANNGVMAAAAASHVTVLGRSEAMGSRDKDRWTLKATYNPT